MSYEFEKENRNTESPSNVIKISKVFDTNNGFNVHNNLKNKSYPELLDIVRSDRLPFSVILLNLEHDLNIGNIIRSCHIFGCSSVIIFGRSRYDLRSTVGAHKYIPIIKTGGTEDTPTSFSSDLEMTYAFKSVIRGIQNALPIFIEKTEDSVSIEKIFSLSDDAIKGKIHPVLIFGNEGNGIPSCILHSYDSSNSKTYHIPQRGVLRSLNVASAAAIALYEVSNIF